MLETGDGRSFFLPVERPGLDLSKWPDHEVILGVRSAQIAGGFQKQEDNSQIHEIECHVQVVEPTGPDSLVFVNINGREVTCRASPKAAKAPG